MDLFGGGQPVDAVGSGPGRALSVRAALSLKRVRYARLAIGKIEPLIHAPPLEDRLPKTRRAPSVSWPTELRQCASSLWRRLDLRVDRARGAVLFENRSNDRMASLYKAAH